MLDLLTLDDGTAMVVREIRPSDKRELQAGLGRLSESSVHARFLSPKPRFSRAELRHLTEVDGTDHYALVAELAAEPGLVMAVGRWVRLHDRPDTAEVAIAIADHLQRRGLGRELGRRLVRAAGERGIRSFTATMSSTNRGAEKLMRSMTAELERSTSRGVSWMEGGLAA